MLFQNRGEQRWYEPSIKETDTGLTVTTSSQLRKQLNKSAKTQAQEQFNNIWQDSWLDTPGAGGT